MRGWLTFGLDKVAKLLLLIALVLEVGCYVGYGWWLFFVAPAVAMIALFLKGLAKR